MNELTRLYGGITGGLCYLMSWIGILVTMALIHRIFQAEKKKERKSLRGREQTNKLAEPALFMMAMNQNVHLWNEMKHALLVLGKILLHKMSIITIICKYQSPFFQKFGLGCCKVNHKIFPPNINIRYLGIFFESQLKPNLWKKALKIKHF